MSPRNPTWSVMKPMAPPPRLKPNSLLLTSKSDSASSTLDWSSPIPPEKYGRNPPPVVPPTGTPTSAFTMKVVTLLLSNRSVSSSSPSKNSGVNAKSASQPSTPAPIQPIDAPQLRCSRPLASPPKPAPTLGVNNQSARADAGASTNARAANIAHFFNIASPPTLRFGRLPLQSLIPPVNSNRHTRTRHPS